MLTIAEVYMNSVLFRCLYTSCIFLYRGGGGPEEWEEDEAKDLEVDAPLVLDHLGRKEAGRVCEGLKRYEEIVSQSIVEGGRISPGEHIYTQKKPVAVIAHYEQQSQAVESARRTASRDLTGRVIVSHANNWPSTSALAAFPPSTVWLCLCTLEIYLKLET